MMASSVVRVLSDISAEPSLSGKDRLFLHEIKLGTFFGQNYIKCKVNTKYDLYSSPTTKRIKLILEEAEDEAGKGSQPPARISIFLNGDFAEGFKEVDVLDTVVISQAIISKSPHFQRDGIHPCIIDVDIAKSKPSVWVIPFKKGKPRQQVGKHPRRPCLFPEATTGEKDMTTLPTRGLRMSAVTGTVQKQVTTITSVAGTSLPVTSVARTSVAGSSVPGTSVAGTSVPGTSVPVTSVPVTSVPGTSVPVTSVPVTSVAGTSVAGTSVPVTSVPVTSVPGTSVPVTSVPVTSVAETSVAGTSVAGTSMAGTSVAVPKGPPLQPRYTYTFLKDLRVNSEVNVFGVVKFFKPPYKTRGPDYCMTVTLIDPSLDKDHRGIRCQLFRTELDALPKIHSIGDIVRFHHLNIEEFNGNMQGQLGDSFVGLVFSGGADEPLEPRTSTTNFNLTEEDLQRVKDLRLWATRCTLLALDNSYRTLGKIYSNQYFDLACQVISVATLTAESCVVLSIWDGTKIRGLTRVIDLSQAVDEKKNATLACRAGDLSVHISLYDDHMEAGKLLEPGQVVKLCNVHAVSWREPGAEEDKSTLELVLHRGTAYGRGVILGPGKEKQVKDMVRRTDDILKNLHRRRVESAIRPTPNPLTQDTTPADPPDQTSSAATTSQQSTQGPRQARTKHRMYEISKRLEQSRASAVQPTSLYRPRQDARTPETLSIMPRSVSVINYPFNYKVTRLRDVIKADSPNNFRIRAKVAVYLPNDTKDFAHLRCPVCKFRCKVTTTKKTEPTQSKRPSDKSKSREERFSQRTGSQKGDGLADSGGSQTAKKCPTSVNKRPPSESTTQSENLPGAAMSTSESEKRMKKTHGEVEQMTLDEAVLLNHRVKTLFGHANLPTGHAREGTDCQGDQVDYACPKCVPIDDDNPQADVPDDSTLLQYRYSLSLILDDGTGSIEVNVDGKQSETFFYGIPVDNLHTSQRTKFMLDDAMAKLCPFPFGQGYDSPDENTTTAIGDLINHPWLDCYIQSYIVLMDNKEVVKYNIFFTALAEDVK
ncbi:protection of telomeres protein 1-like [Asterias amurensis]|uniref:protection of telomeres protein 1-like n=1 Tax=Asterias amurensis TaxID=7602 RepID=UPI003AB3057A